ncbi:MAG TPA: chemotaxis-specific protein-glutamate methyltransferase CheB [Gammaproteobacteria bacterium]|jgi:two-component system chemotaxis response regulator CheB|nr:chemotaxis-specific protein-glutamate methyltransferase CheB [Gammaproteobacteria bacterium]
MIKILIVDDSATETNALKHLFENEKDMQVIGTASSGEEALKCIPQLKPDIITMDIHMPGMNGFDTTRKIMELYPTPLVIISDAVSDPHLNATFKALEAGALSILKKPHLSQAHIYEEEKKRIIDTIRMMSEIKVVRRRFHPQKKIEKNVSVPKDTAKQHFDIIAIGASIGGPQALRTILEKIPADFPIPIVIVQHMTRGFIKGFAKWLNACTSLHIKSAEDKEVLQGGTVYFAPDTYHLEIQRKNDTFIAHLVSGETVSGFCPSATVLLNSIAKVVGKHAIGILLTGMGHDGAVGLLEVKKAGGLTLIQDPESSVVFGMAGTAQSIGAVTRVVPLQEMADYLIKIC